MTTSQPPQPRLYLQLLEVAYSLGRADGGLAARVEPEDSVAPQSTCCQGHEPEEFARLLWADRPGAPPSGLRLNAPLWYAHGFAEGLAAERQRDRYRQAAAAWAGGAPRSDR